MNFQLRLIFAVLMVSALFFGFLHLFWIDSGYNFERLHVFLFNLCSGGTIILIYTENLKHLTVKTCTFLVVALFFAIVAFLEMYSAAIAAAVFLSLTVESVRIRAFSLLPISFFSPKEPIFKKFHQASLLCLSIGLLFSAFVMWNNNFYYAFEFPKLNLDIFFLGFSFPVSLITMSVIFSMIKEDQYKPVRSMKEIGFWVVNLGVIVFFCFIIFDVLLPQVIVTLLLFCGVIMILFLFYKFSKRMQQKSFLISGLVFLLFSALTGIAYIILEIINVEQYYILERILRLHVFYSLYGWNLCGLAVICRFYDFPIRLHSRWIILIHWLTITVAGTIADYYFAAAVFSIIGYAVILYMMFFTEARGRYPSPGPKAVSSS